MVFLATFVAFPLGLLKNIESLSNISAMSIGFYTVFVAEVSDNRCKYSRGESVVVVCRY